MRFSGKLVFIITGSVSTLWFLVRVIPKPSRASYPCMRAAAPLMSGFVVYMTGLVASLFVFKKSLEFFRKNRYLAACILLAVAAIAAFGYNTLTVRANPLSVKATPESFTPNQPVGTAMGIKPGRVVLVHDADATNQYFTPSSTRACFQVENVDSAIINRMTVNAVLSLAGETDIKEAWDALFRYFNSRHGKGNIGYQAGEKIFIKINCNSAWGHPSVSGSEFNIYGNSLGRNLTEDYSFKNNVPAFGTHDGGPYIMLSLLRQLIDEAGIPEGNIYLGDPMRDIHKYNFDIMHEVFPGVHFIGHSGTFDRTTTTITSDTVVYFSDQGKILRNYNGAALKGSKVFSVVRDADYMINLAALKAHSGEGITSSAKNNFGNIGRIWALEMHNGMVSPDFDMASKAKGSYRVLVDLMGHRDLGGKTVLCLVDGTFFSPDAYGRPVKFQNAPYNGDWPSTILASQDMVAIESVCYDIIASQWVSGCAFSYVTMTGICEHLEQAADPTKWPAGIRYDPERDGIAIGSLGVYEHWNNATERKYSRNLGSGNGIELIQLGPVDGLIACPLQLTARNISATEIEISWKDNSSKENGYTIEVSEGDSLHYAQVTDLVSNTQSYRAGGLTEGLKYYFRVRAYNGTATSSYSNEVACIASIPSTLHNRKKSNDLALYKTGNNEISLSFGYEPSGNTSISIYNTSGRLVGSQVFFKPRGRVEKSIYLPDEKGTYLVKVQCEMFAATGKICM